MTENQRDSKCVLSSMILTGSSLPSRSFSRVVLPTPLGPTMATVTQHTPMYGLRGRLVEGAEGRAGNVASKEIKRWGGVPSPPKALW